MSKLKFFVDFDGTISKSDVIDTILEKFANHSWQIIEEKWAKGEIGSRECLSTQLSLVKISETELNKIIQEMPVDAGFQSFLEICHTNDIPVTIVSDGLDYVIKGILKEVSDLAENLPVYSNSLIWKKEGIEIQFPEGPLCRHACANCKERVIQKLSKVGDYVAFVGDGLSDRYAARFATLTFAKKKLLDFCKQENINHKPFTSFHEIVDWVKKYQIEKNKLVAKVL